MVIAQTTITVAKHRVVPKEIPVITVLTMVGYATKKTVPSEFRGLKNAV